MIRIYTYLYYWQAIVFITMLMFSGFKTIDIDILLCIIDFHILENPI